MKRVYIDCINLADTHVDGDEWDRWCEGPEGDADPRVTPRGYANGIDVWDIDVATDQQAAAVVEAYASAVRCEVEVLRVETVQETVVAP